MTKEELLKEVVEQLKAESLPLAEDAVEKVLIVIEKVLVKYVETSETKIDDMALPIVSGLFALVKKQADKIDGKEG